MAMSDDFRALPLENSAVQEPAEPLDIADIRNSLKALMWRAAGVRRSGEMLHDAHDQVEQWQKYVLVQQFDDAQGWELQNMLTICGLMIDAAMKREESRGTHQRTDFPATDDAHWNRHLAFRRNS
jgi:L-aspartate oxidase